MGSLNLNNDTDVFNDFESRFLAFAGYYLKEVTARSCVKNSAACYRTVIDLILSTYFN